MIYLLYPVRPTHALIGYDSCITNKASPAFSSLQRWMLPAWEVPTGPLTNMNPVKSQTWDTVTAQAHPRTIPCHQWVKRGIHHISTFSEQNTLLFEVLELFSWRFLFFKNRVKNFIIFLVKVTCSVFLSRDWGTNRHPLHECPELKTQL